MLLFLNLLGEIQDKHNGPYPGNNIFGSTFDTGGPKEYEVGTCQVIRNMMFLAMSDGLSRCSSFLDYLDLVKIKLQILI